jgi:small nuclear ribonucleoprotein (snRNP)-like protein
MLRIKSILFFFALGLLALARNATADVVETKSGAHLVGMVVGIDGSMVTFATNFGGELKIKQSEVTSISTEKPLNVRLSSGTVLQGTLTGLGNGLVLLTGPDGMITTGIDKLAATWEPGTRDPEIAALHRAWTYEAAIDIVGKTGNSQQLGTSFSFRATLKTSLDILMFYTAYDRQVTEGQKSADQFKAGADYQYSFSGRYSWYLRDEVGFDRIKLIEFSNVAAVGIGYDMIKKPKHTLTVRMGFAHRFESYRADPVIYASLIDPPPPGVPIPADQARRLATKESVNSAGLDLGISHSLQLSNFSIVNRLSIVPTFNDFNDYHATHESFLELPLVDPSWKLRMGVSNDYTSKPAQGKKQLDTTYFTRFVLSWR